MKLLLSLSLNLKKEVVILGSILVHQLLGSQLKWQTEMYSLFCRKGLKYTGLWKFLRPD